LDRGEASFVYLFISSELSRSSAPALHCSPRSPTRADPPGVSAGVLASRGVTAPGRLAPAPFPLTQTSLTQPQLLAELHPHSPVPRQYLPLGHWRCCSVTELVVARKWFTPPRRCGGGGGCSVRWLIAVGALLRCPLVLYAPRAGRTPPAGEGGCAAGSLPPSHYLKLGPAVRCRSSPEFPFRFIWVLGWSTPCKLAPRAHTAHVQLMRSGVMNCNAVAGDIQWAVHGKCTALPFAMLGYCWPMSTHVGCCRDQRCDAVGCRHRCRLLSLMSATFDDVGYFSSTAARCRLFSFFRLAQPRRCCRLTGNQ
jgi:hypothetical protein